MLQKMQHLIPSLLEMDFGVRLDLLVTVILSELRGNHYMIVVTLVWTDYGNHGLLAGCMLGSWRGLHFLSLGSPLVSGASLVLWCR